MISSIQGVVKVKGDINEIMADISVLVEALIDEGTLDVGDIMDAVTFGLERKGVGVIRSIEELDNFFIKNMDEIIEKESPREGEIKDEIPLTADEIFRAIFKNKGE